MLELNPITPTPTSQTQTMSKRPSPALPLSNNNAVANNPYSAQNAASNPFASCNMLPPAFLVNLNIVAVFDGDWCSRIGAQATRASAVAWRAECLVPYWGAIREPD